MKVTIKDVAKVAGVSFKSVSRVVNEEPGVTEKLKKKVWAAINELNYKPNQTARRLRGKSSNIGFIYDNPNSHYVVTMLHGILNRCRKNNYELVVHPVSSETETLVKDIQAFVDRTMIAGLVITPPISEDEKIIEALDKTGIKFVRIVSDSRSPQDIERTIYVNDRLAAYQITQHLIDQNHKRISFFNGDLEHKSSPERLAGYRAALEDNSIDVDESLILQGQYLFESGVERCKQVLEMDNPPTAIFACNDEIAAGALFAARMSGCDVPENMSIVGFEDSPFSRQTWPALTTAKQPNDEIAGHAAQLLIDIIEDPDKAKNGMANHGYLPELVIRDSTLALPN